MSNHFDQTAFHQMAELIEELLDAHCDTVCLEPDGDPLSPTWAAHIAYLKDLQRVGQRTLAELAINATLRPQSR